ncbi:ubiquitin-conjugating enzyme family protein [Colletotrichum camelliae]|nr:ubiquitin-conjugating enzyme family protein [Colletotrichum camelliae]
MASQSHLRQRLLQDIAELQREPYPRISLHTSEDLTTACLVIQAEGWMPIHMTIEFGDRYPLVAPKIKMNTRMNHPNVFSSYICASILNTSEGYTPAYTLKGIAIQMLSFFNSENVEQIYSGAKYGLKHFRQESLAMKQTFVCSRCDFDGTQTKADIRRLRRAQPQTEDVQTEQERHQELQCALSKLPDELILETLENLGFEELIAFSHAWPKVAKIIADFDLIRLRELQCFFSKANFQNAKLGVGVDVSGHGKRSIQSEFDLISQAAFRDLGIRQSVHNLRFQYWLPLPISRRHWRSVQEDVPLVMNAIAGRASLPSRSSVDVLAAFMNDIVVRLNQVEAKSAPRRASYQDGYDDARVSQKSTLRHASEKAIESYFHLYHLLLCLATSDELLVRAANTKIQNFMKGQTSKEVCPNLGHLLVYLLISDAAITEKMRKAIITEAITRNVVWMLDKRGANRPELSYLEPDKVSTFRLRKTFEASRTSYRLLMFSELFRRIARPSNEKSLVEVRDELFDRHGAPPQGAALQLSTDVRRLHDIDNFHDFFGEMGIENKPSAEWFTSHLRECVRGSMARGYSVWGLPATTALALRRQLEPSVGLYGDQNRSSFITSNAQRQIDTIVTLSQAAIG